MFPNKISKCGHFYTLHVYPVITKVIFLISGSLGILTVLTQTILIRYEFSSVTMFVSKQKNDIIDEIRSKLMSVFKIMSSTKITSSEHGKHVIPIFKCKYAHM